MKRSRYHKQTDLTTLHGDVIAVDTETTGLSVWHGARPFAFSFCNEEGDTRYLRVTVDPFTRVPQLDSKTLQMLRYIFRDERRKEFVFWNAKFDVRMFESIGVQVPHKKVHDAMFAMHVLRSSEPTFKLKPMAKKYVDMEDDDQKALQRQVMIQRRKGKAYNWNIGDNVYEDYWMAPRDICEEYAVKDAIRTMLLWQMARELMPDENVLETYEEEMRLWPIVYEMETYGVRLNYEENERQIKHWKQKQHEALARCISLAGMKFDPKKPHEIRYVLYKKLKLKQSEVTDTLSLPSTAAGVLKHMEHPVARAILEYRAAGKAVSTFFERYKKSATQDNTGQWIIHPEFRQVGPRTGRFSSANPNMQNVADEASANPVIPIQARIPLGPRTGYNWYASDYSQMETRLFADAAQEGTMLTAFRNGDDLHALTAALCWPEEVAAAKASGDPQRYKHMRNRAKFFNFGIIYGIGPKSAAKQLNVTEKLAKQFLDDYRKRFPHIEDYMTELSKQAVKRGEIRTMYGRRVPVDAERAYAAVNYQIQGTAADIIKRAMRKVDKNFKQKGADGHLVLTIHDELISEVRKSHAYRHVLRGVCKAMEDTDGVVGIPLPTEMSVITESWARKRKIKL